MDVHSSSNGLHHVVGYGSNSVVIAHSNNNNQHHHNDYNNYYVPPLRSLPKATSYQFLPVVNLVPTIINVPVQQSKNQQQSHGNHL